MTSRLIGLDPIRPPVRQSKGLSGELKIIHHPVARSMTAQQPRFRPSSLRVTTHSRQASAFSGGGDQSVYSTSPVDMSYMVSRNVYLIQLIFRQIYLTPRFWHWLWNIQLLQVRVDMIIMIIKEYFTLSRASESMSHHKMRFSELTRHCIWGVP